MGSPQRSLRNVLDRAEAAVLLPPTTEPALATLLRAAVSHALLYLPLAVLEDVVEFRKKSGIETD